MDKRDYYDVLGVSQSSDKSTIKKAYRKLAMQYHPDRNPNDALAENKFKEASEAAEVLLDDSKKQRYDQFGHAGLEGQTASRGGSGDFGDLGDIFGDIFGDFMGGGRSRGRKSFGRPGNDLQIAVNITFEEAAFGTKKKIALNKLSECNSCQGSGGKNGSTPTACTSCQGTGEIRRQQGFFMVASTCPRCNGSGQMISNPCNTCRGDGRTKKNTELEVTIPAGIDHEQRLKLSNEGDSGIKGGENGDLYVVIQLKKHNLFEREGFDVYYTLPISFAQAALGSRVEVPTLNGKVVVTIPAGTQSGKKMRLKGKGVQKLGGYGQGDAILSLHVETPTELSQEQKDLIEKLDGLKGSNNKCHPMSKGFFDKVRDLFQ